MRVSHTISCTYIIYFQLYERVCTYYNKNFGVRLEYVVMEGTQQVDGQRDQKREREGP
jgi:hypothetical protein